MPRKKVSQQKGGVAARRGGSVCTIDGIEVLLGLIVQFLGLLFEFLKPPLSVQVDRVLGMLANIELGLELLWSADNALLKALQTHL